MAMRRIVVRTNQKRYKTKPRGERGEEVHSAHKRHCDWLATKLQIRDLDGWYNVNIKKLMTSGGESLLNQYGGSLIATLTTLYPEKQWLAWQFQQVPRNYWTSLVNQRKYFDWLATHLNIENSPMGWSNVLQDTVVKCKGSGLLTYYRGSLTAALKAVYPEYDWNEPSRREATKSSEELEKYRQHLNWIGNKLGVKKYDDWYKIKCDDVVKTGGGTLLTQFGGSLARTLRELYTEYEWHNWLFWKTPRHYWSDPQHVTEYLKWYAAKKNITSPEQWYKVTSKSVARAGGGGMLAHCGSLFKALQIAFPEYEWYSVFRLSEGQNNTWRLLSSLLREHMLINYRHPQLTHPSGNLMELDIYVPSLRLAFEYQGSQHYSNNRNRKHEHEGFRFTKYRAQRDEEKRAACSALGISLIEIPYWWHASLVPLVNTLRFVRPDVKLHLPTNVSRYGNHTANMFGSESYHNNWSNSF